MRYLITIDGGTTNTRLTLLQGETVCARKTLHRGARDDTAPYAQELSRAMRELLATRGASVREVEAVIASGMIGSEMGLCAVAHLEAPIRREALARGMVKKSLPEVSDAAIYFIPGIRCRTAEGVVRDLMRGEETEFFGMPREMYSLPRLLTVLPGSHTKLILSENGCITECITTLGGEMIQALSEHTLLHKLLALPLPAQMEEAWLLRGCETALEQGLGRTLFQTRVLALGETSPAQRSAFFLGAVLSGDLQVIDRCAGERQIVLGGTGALCDTVRLLIERVLKRTVLCPPPSQTPLSVLGAASLYRTFCDEKWGCRK